MDGNDMNGQADLQDFASSSLPTSEMLLDEQQPLAQQPVAWPMPGEPGYDTRLDPRSADFDPDWVPGDDQPVGGDPLDRQPAPPGSLSDFKIGWEPVPFTQPIVTDQERSAINERFGDGAAETFETMISRAMYGERQANYAHNYIAQQAGVTNEFVSTFGDPARFMPFIDASIRGTASGMQACVASAVAEAAQGRSVREQALVFERAAQLLRENAGMPAKPPSNAPTHVQPSPRREQPIIQKGQQPGRTSVASTSPRQRINPVVAQIMQTFGVDQERAKVLANHKPETDEEF